MIILTCANVDVAGNKFNNPYVFHKTFSFKIVIEKTVAQAQKCGYRPVVYDLGSLGIGERFYIADETFSRQGFYSVEVKKGYKSRSLFKPRVARHCLTHYRELTAYLDADAQLVGRLDEIDTPDYDIGVTLRKSTELEADWHKNLFDIVKFLNAGVIFFKPTPAAFRFVETWEKKTQEMGNDQMALNALASPSTYPKAMSVLTLDGVRIKYFPAEQYNYCYFDEGLEPDIKIYHFKGNVREYFPFDWKKRLYCRFLLPPLNRLSVALKKAGLRKPNSTAGGEG
jgi:hypothetical protein